MKPETEPIRNYHLYFECKHKFGSVRIEANNLKEAKLKASGSVKHGAWCDNRCNNCNLKIND